MIFWISFPHFTISINYDEHGVLFDGNGKEVLVLAPSELTTYLIPKETRTITGGSKESGPFYPCRNNLKSLIFEDGSSLVDTGTFCFAYLSELTHLDMTPCTKLKYINNGMFFYCTKIVSLFLPPNIEIIRSSSIINTNISNLTIPASVARLESWDSTYNNGAINFNSNLERVIWSEGSKIEYIGSVGFTSNSLTSFHIPKSLTVLGNEALGNNRLESITVEAGNPVYRSDGLLLLNSDSTAIVICPNAITACPAIPPAVTTIGAGAFQSTSILEIDIPFGIEVLDRNSFARSSLARVSIPPSVTEIRAGAFWWCTNLNTIAINTSNLASVSEGLFLDCANLREVIVPRGVSALRKSAFEGCCAITHIFVPNTTITIESAAFARINDAVFIEFEEKSNFYINNLVLYNSGRDQLLAFFGSSGDNIDVNVDWRTETIGSSAFEGSKVSTIIFPSNSSLKTIESSAFRGTELKSIRIPNNATIISEKSFFGCTKLESVILGKSIQTIEREASTKIDLVSIHLKANLVFDRCTACYRCG